MPHNLKTEFKELFEFIDKSNIDRQNKSTLYNKVNQLLDATVEALNE